MSTVLREEKKMVTPCPYCGAEDIRLVVHLHATQYARVSPLRHGGYSYIVTDEEIAEHETEILLLTCCQCGQDWVPGEEG